MNDPSQALTYVEQLEMSIAEIHCALLHTDCTPSEDNLGVITSRIIREIGRLQDRTDNNPRNAFGSIPVLFDDTGLSRTDDVQYTPDPGDSDLY